MQKKTDLEAKKKLGQNFLVNGGAQLRVVNAFRGIVDQYQPDWIFEIGPGRGDISQHIVDFGLIYFALEYDHDAISYLNKKDYVQNKKLNVVHGDGLEIMEKRNGFLQEYLSENSLDKIDLSDNFCLFSSLPYNIGSRILVDIGVNYPQLPFTVIIQKEVASKVKIEQNKLTVFGIWLNLFWDLEIVADLAGGNFYPAPKVTSSILTGRPKKMLPDFLNTDIGRKNTLQMVKSILAFPKKTLSNNLRGMSWNQIKIDQFLIKNSLDATSRLTKQNYLSIIENLSKEIQGNKN
jgi:16S rRNA A1518/A1519 N6-dimethyltransferase RsmA/KsgA/DIM1 with predicted DNA glycosylase/AP lyase activity